MKKAIIVGATSGIGQSLSRVLVGNGYAVGITGRRQHLLSELANENPGHYFTKCFDVTDTSLSVTSLKELADEMGGMDLLVISSGMGDVNEALDFGIEKQMIDLNVSGFTCVADWGFNYFREQGYGHLVGISSLAGIRGSRQAPAYSATKAFQIRYLESLRQMAYRVKGEVVVTDIRPGFVDTPMAKSPVKFWVVPVKKAANQIFTGIKSRKGVVYISKRWRVIAWVLKLLPSWLHKRM